jgi:ABC-type Na+ transport system ATPase subunit NatA
MVRAAPRRNRRLLAIEQGEIVGLLGPNGSGKSTIFRMLTGYLVPTSGRIEVAGHDVVADSLTVRRVISYVPEDAPLYDHMLVGEFLHFMANLKGLRGAAAKAAVDAAAERLDLTGVMLLLTGKLSRGFRQRVSIAQALLGDPQVLVLDEPTSGLDPHQVIAVRDLIQPLEGSRTVLIASHILPSRLNPLFDPQESRKPGDLARKSPRLSRPAVVRFGSGRDRARRRVATRKQQHDHDQAHAGAIFRQHDRDLGDRRGEQHFGL